MTSDILCIPAKWKCSRCCYMDSAPLLIAWLFFFFSLPFPGFTFVYFLLIIKFIWLGEECTNKKADRNWISKTNGFQHLCKCADFIAWVELAHARCAKIVSPPPMLLPITLFLVDLCFLFTSKIQALDAIGFFTLVALSHCCLWFYFAFSLFRLVWAKTRWK